MVSSDLRMRLSVPQKIRIRLAGVKPSNMPPMPPASSRLVPVGDAQFSVNTAGSTAALDTTGGVRVIALFSTGTFMGMDEIPYMKLGALAVPPLRNVFTGVNPHVNTNTESRIHGIHALNFRP